MTETINGLHVCRPENEPTEGETKRFVVLNMPAKDGKKAWLKIRGPSREQPGSTYRVVTVTPTGWEPDSYGNISFNLEIEPTNEVSGTNWDRRDKGLHGGVEEPQERPAQAPQAPPARQNGQDVANHAKTAREVFDAAWYEAGTVMKGLMPTHDVEAMTIKDWYDLKMRVAQFIAIQTQRSL